MQGELGSAAVSLVASRFYRSTQSGPVRWCIRRVASPCWFAPACIRSCGFPLRFLVCFPRRRIECGADERCRTRASWWPLPVAESYVRGNDLVATYAPIDTWPYSPQVYSRKNALQLVDGVLGSLSLLLSVQTHLLDTHPQINVASQVPGSECMHIVYDSDGTAEVDRVEVEQLKAPSGDMSAVLYRLLHDDCSYVEIVRATDNRGIAFRPTPDGKLRAEWQLFADFLEKGVIRRAHEFMAQCCRERTTSSSHSNVAGRSSNRRCR